MLEDSTQPMGVTDISSEALSCLREDNRSLEISSWIAEQALRCQPQRVAIVMVYPEDNVGHILSGLSSPWCLNEFSMLEDLNDAMRGAGFSRQLTKAEPQLHLGIFSNLTSLQKDMSVGWPQFS